MISGKQVHIVLAEMPDSPWPETAMPLLFHTFELWSRQHVGIHIHIFLREGQESRGDLSFALSTRYYNLRKGHHAVSGKLPYCVCSRINQELFQRLMQDDYPIILVGLSATCILQEPALGSRRIFLLMNRVEHEYYQVLQKLTRSPLQRLLMSVSARKLKAYEQQVIQQVTVLSFSDRVLRWYSKSTEGQVLPVDMTLPDAEVKSLPGTGSFCLLHADLSSPHQEAAVSWMLRRIFLKTPIPVVIAGSQASPQFQDYIHRHSRFCLVSNPDAAELADLMRKAHITLTSPLPSVCGFATLLPALAGARHIVVPASAGLPSWMLDTCHQASDAGSYRKIINQLYDKPFTEADRSLRQAIFESARSENGRDSIAPLIFS